MLIIGYLFFNLLTIIKQLINKCRAANKSANLAI